MLSISNLRAEVDGNEILKGLSLEVPSGEVHAIMGPNGAGKSTLSYVLTGREGYDVTAGTATLDGEDLLSLDPAERAAKGIFLAFQYPVEIPGVATMQFLKVAMNSQRKQRGEAELTTPDFMRRVKEAAAELKIAPEMLRRPLNVGFSGGEKKKAEILQLLLLNPSLAILDETDSGLDVDAVRTVSKGIEEYQKSKDGALLIITHSTRILESLHVDKTHVLVDGRLVAEGDGSLVDEINENGFEQFIASANEKGEND